MFSLPARAALDLNLGDGRGLLLDIDPTHWTFEQDGGLPSAGFRFRRTDGARVIGGFKVLLAPFNDELLASLRRTCIGSGSESGTTLREADLHVLEVPDGAGYRFEHTLPREPVDALQGTAHVGFVALRSGVVLSYYVAPESPATTALLEEFEAAACCATIHGEIDDELVASVADGKIHVKLQFVVGSDGTPVEVTVIETENAAYNDRAKRQLMRVKYSQIRPGRTVIQPVILELDDPVPVPQINRGRDLVPEAQKKSSGE